MHARLLDGTVSVVTGASSGIGAAIARALAAQGAWVGLVARRRDRLEALATEINQQGGRALVCQADVANKDQARRAIEIVVTTFGRLDLLVNSAGLLLVGPALNTPLEDWERMVAVNVQGVLYCTHVALPHLVAAARDSPRNVADLVNISSVSGRKVVDNSAVYTLTKMGVGGFSDGIRAELALHGVRVSLIEPGPTTSELLTHTRPEALAQLSHLAKGTPIKRLDPEDVAEAVVFTVSRSSRVAVNEILLRPTISPF